MFENSVCKMLVILSWHQFVEIKTNTITITFELEHCELNTAIIMFWIKSFLCGFWFTSFIHKLGNSVQFIFFPGLPDYIYIIITTSCVEIHLSSSRESRHILISYNVLRLIWQSLVFITQNTVILLIKSNYPSSIPYFPTPGRILYPWLFIWFPWAHAQQ